MQGFAEKKSDKLVRVNVDYTDRINSISISGDFFIHPEEFLEEIEKTIKGTKISEISKIGSRVSDLLKSNKVETIGITPEIIEELVREAVK